MIKNLGGGSGTGGGVTSIVFGAGLTGGTVTTTGNVALDTTAANNFSTAQTITRAPAVNTSIDGLILQDTTAATVGGQQFSPRLHLIGQGWGTTTPASATVDWIVENIPVQGTTNPTGSLVFSSQIAGGGYSAFLTLSTTGIGALVNGTLQTSGTVRAVGGFIGTQNTKMIDSNTVPTIASGFGTSPSVVNNNGPFSFSVNVGTGGAATSGVITLPAAAHGWSCFASDVGATPTGRTEPTAMTTTSVTLTNFSRTTGTALAWTASEIIQVSCIAN